MSYASLGDLKSAIRITDIDSDGLLQIALDAATGAIDEHCNRTFTASTVVSLRHFEPTGDGSVVTDDFYSADGLVISSGGTAIPAGVIGISAGYFLTPANAVALGEPLHGLPIFRLSALGISAIPCRVTGDRSGYRQMGVLPGDTPAVKMACLLQASRWFARRNSPYGIAGSPEMGSELRLLAKLDADVAVMLSGKVRY